jgi:hypothetical protein
MPGQIWRCLSVGRTPSHARVPFKASYLPAGWAVVKIDGRDLTGEDTVPIMVVFGPVSKATAHTNRQYDDPSDGSAVEIDLVRHQNPLPPDAPKTKKTCIPNSDPAPDFWCSWDIPHTNYSCLGPAVHCGEPVPKPKPPRRLPNSRPHSCLVGSSGGQRSAARWHRSSRWAGSRPRRRTGGPGSPGRRLRGSSPRSRQSA